MVQILITKELGHEYAIHLKGTNLLGVHMDVMGMRDCTKSQNIINELMYTTLTILVLNS